MGPWTSITFPSDSIQSFLLCRLSCVRNSLRAVQEDKCVRVNNERGVLLPTGGVYIHRCRPKTDLMTEKVDTAL